VEDWWSGIEREVHECLDRHGELSPAELGRQLGMSEAATASLLALMSANGKIRISRVASLRGPRALGRRGAA
jgi:hypothetical protein